MLDGELRQCDAREQDGYEAAATHRGHEGRAAQLLDARLGLRACRADGARTIAH